ncbi:MAG: asparagine synthase (glutamine-hydrolyzing) [Woeseiaceae bacterium]|nr:asparagine synthase (glutamine-hydrolyzing) [Woeseiaceae bacterium]
MCGIAGATGPDAGALTRRMVPALVHRGPDDDGYYEDDSISLGFRRLSIVDLSGGSQPMQNETGDIWLICNGEIYNSGELRKALIEAGHRFRTRCDVEVILHLYEEYGEDCVGKLRGMFAFAIWDARRKTLVLARDHMGQKPLFYFDDGERFLFASEVQALMASGAVAREPNLNALWHYVSLRSVPDDLSLIRGLRKLPAASVLVRDQDGSTRTRRYWAPDFRAKISLNDDDAADALDACLREAVASHLQSDVPVGVFLSGGIDSTTIGALMAGRSGPRTPAFSIGVADTSFDELPAAQRVAAKWNMQFHGERVRADVAGLLPRLVHHLGEPADPYAVGIYLVSRLAADHVKVVLSGDGGDESFGGYDRYLGQRLVDYYALLPRGLRRPALRALMAVIPETNRYKSLAQRLAWLQSVSEVDGGERYARTLGVLRFTGEERDRLFHPDVVRSLPDPDTLSKVLRYYDAPDVESLTDRMLFTDLMTRVPDHNLVMGDRMSMACSLEVRAPFVDPRVVEFAASLPANMKVRGRSLKYLLRRVATRYLPRDIARMPKQGFGFPVGRWLRGELRTLVQSRLLDSKLAAAGVFRQEPITRLLDEHLQGRADHSYRLWLLLGLEIWYDIYIEGLTIDSIASSLETVGFGTES